MRSNDNLKWMDTPKKLMKWFQIGFVIVWLACVSITISYFAVSYKAGLWIPNNHPRISEYSICRGPDPVTGKPVGAGVHFPKDVQPIYFCGLVETRIPTSLTVLWYRDPDDLPFYSVREEIWQRGYMFSRLDKSGLPPGIYRVDILDGRIVITSISFDIR
jgi:hypothetical protein